MKNLLLLSLKKKLIISAAAVILTSGGVAASLHTPQEVGADTSPIIQQVQRNTEELNNHDARIANAENDIKDLQDKTGTPPSTNTVYVPAVITPAPTTPITDPISPAPATAPVTPAPIIVKSSGLIIGGSYDSYCLLTYSDGSIDHVKANITVTTNGNQSSAQDDCQSFVGQVKS